MDMPHSRKTRLWAVAAVAAVGLIDPAIALARAGGGQNYGGSGGGGGGFGGGGGLWGLWPLLFLGHGSGFGGLVTFLIILYVFQQLRRRSGSGGVLGDILDGGSPPSPGMPAGQVLDVPAQHYNPNTAADGIAAIKAKDANFDEKAFLDRAQTSFFKVQQAWAARNQDLARDSMSGALYERHKMQTDQLIANHQIDILENIVIGNAHIISASAGTAFDSIVVAFTASMTDYTVDEKTRQTVSGNQFRQTFTEFWTFIRRADAKTTTGQTALSPTCASCGAPLKLTDGKCDYCGAYARTTSADWVVDTIEQP
jgi:inner membrane protein import complex subunit Tim44-like protein